jgi:hypothetical protein
MTTHAAVDALVAAWGVFDRSRAWPHVDGAPATAEGAALRRWLARLTPGALAEALAIHDEAWVQLTLAMAAQRDSKADCEGLHFFVDVEQPPALRGASQHGADVPAVCYRRPSGVSARLDRQRDAGAALESGIRIACNEAGAPCTLSFTLDGCADGGTLLRHLDELSWGQFLSKPPAWRPDGATHAGLVALGGGQGAAERWIEMPWLTGLGFYSLAAHIANRLEIAIWARWRSASRRGKEKVASSQAALPSRLARLDATSALQQHAGVAQAAVARRLSATLRRRAGACDDWAAMRACLEDAVAAMSALADVGSDALLHTLVWQPLHLASSRTGSLLAQCGCAALSAVEVAVSDSAAADLLQDEQADHAAAAAGAARKAAQRATQAAAADRARIKAAAAKVTSDAVTRVLARAAADEQAAAHGRAQYGQQAAPRRSRPLPGWMPSVTHHQGSAPFRAPCALERVSSTPLLRPEACEPGQGVQADEPASPVSPRDSQMPPWAGYPAGFGDAPATWSAPTTPGHDFGEAFDGGLFWSNADLMQMQRAHHQRMGSAASDVSSEDSGYLTTSNSSAAAWREALVGRLVETPEPSPGRASRPSHPSLGSRSGMSSPLSVPWSSHHRRDDHHTLARSLAGSPTSGFDDTLRRSRGSSAEPKRPQSPLTLQPVHIAPQARTPSARATPPRPPPPSDAFEPRVLFTAAQLRRLTAPVGSTTLSSEASPFADAMAARAAFWTASGSEGAHLAMALGEHLLSFYRTTVEGASAARPARLAAVHRVTRVLQDLWPRARTRVFGSESLGLSLPSSDVDVLVQLPLVRQLPPIEEAGILEGRNGITESVLKTAFRRLGACEWVVADTLKLIDNTAVPIISLAVGSRDAVVKLDLSFDGPHHQGVASGELVRGLLARWPVLAPLICCLKQFLSDRSLHHAYTGGLNSYGLTLLCAAFVKHAEATGLVAPCSLSSADALARPEVVGTLFSDFLHFYGHVLDPRKRMVALAPDESDGGPFLVSSLFPLRTREALIDVLHIADPLQGSHVNAGRNCFRYVQLQRAFAEASTHLESKPQPNLKGLFGLGARDPM